MIALLQVITMFSIYIYMLCNFLVDDDSMIFRNFSFSGLSHDDIIFLFTATEHYFTMPSPHRTVPLVADVRYGFVSIVLSFLVFSLTNCD